MADARITITAEDKTGAALASLRRGLGDVTNQAGALQSAFRGLAPVLTFTGLAAGIKNINDGVDALNDLKDATGASIENISALEDLANRTGVSFDTVGTALVKFSQLLNEAKPGSDAEKSLAAIGLKAEELKKIDPAEALRRYAVALKGYADDGNKARLVQDQLGKSLREVAPLLNDLGEKSELLAKVTTQQAEEAEKFNKQLFELQKNAKDAGRALSAQLIPALSDMLKTIEAGRKSTDGFFDAITTLGTINPFYTEGENIKRYRAELEELTVARERYAKLGFSTSAYDKDIQDLQKKLAYLKEVQAQEALAKGTDNQSGAEDRRLRTVTVKSTVNFDPDAFKKNKAAREKRLAEQKKTNELIAKAIEEGAEEEQRTLNEAQKLGSEFRIRAQEEELAAREKMMQQWFQTIDQEQEDAIAGGRAIIDAADEDAKRLKDTARELGLTFSSAAEDAIVNFKELGDVIDGVGKDILRLTVRKNFTEPLGNSVSKWAGGLDFGSLFGGGGGTSSIPIDGYAGGGWTGGGARSGGLDGQGGFLAMLHPQESVIDHTMPMMPGSGGAAQITYAPVVNIDSRTDRREVAALVDRALRNNNAALVDQLQRQGRI